MAADYNHLGNVYGVRGELDKVVEFCRKSLELNEALDYKKGMASSYIQLSIVYEARSELDKAEEVLNQALSLFQSVGDETMVKEISLRIINLK